MFFGLGTQFANENMEPRVRKGLLLSLENIWHIIFCIWILDNSKNIFKLFVKFHFYWFNVIHDNIDNIPTLSLHKT